MEAVRDVGGDKCFDGRRALIMRKTVLSDAHERRTLPWELSIRTVCLPKVQGRRERQQC